jgi:hypothetical protein
METITERRVRKKEEFKDSFPHPVKKYADRYKYSFLATGPNTYKIIHKTHEDRHQGMIVDQSIVEAARGARSYCAVKMGA